MARLRVHGATLFLVPSLVGLVVVFAILAAGSAPRRVWPIAGFLLAWAASGSYVLAATRALRQRAFRQRRTPVPRNVRLVKPLWIHLDGLLTMVSLTAALGTIVAAIGFPGLAVGVLLVLGGMLVVGGVASVSDVRGLTFEDTGLRIQVRSAECLVPWGSIRAVTPIGPDHCQMVGIRVDDLERVLAGISPASPTSRSRVVGTFGGASSGLGQIVFDPWTAGLDGQVLARGIREGMDGRAERAN